MSNEKQYFTPVEILEDILDVLESGYDGPMEELHNEVFNTGYYIIGTWLAKQALEEFGVFEAIDKVQTWEHDNLGELYTDVSDPEKLANMLYFVLGEMIMFDLQLDECEVPEAIDIVKARLEQEIKEEAGE